MVIYTKLSTYKIIITCTLVQVLISCAAFSQDVPVNLSQRNIIQVMQVDQEKGYQVNYTMYVADENIEVYLDPQAKILPLSESYNKLAEPELRKKIEQELREKIAKELRKKIEKEVQKENEKTVSRAVSSSTNSYLQAQSAFISKNYNKALKHIAKSLSHAPESPAVLSLAGSIYYSADYNKKAIKFWKKALKKDPSLTGVRNMLRRAQTKSQ
jgi:tetratricopeptide (TPR) repeat protein